MNIHPQLAVDSEVIAAFCRRWRIVEFELFGSVLTEEFRPDSDVDVLVTFATGTEWRLHDLVEMREELTRIFGRRVDLVERAAVEESENPFRRSHILSNRQRVYAA